MGKKDYYGYGSIKYDFKLNEYIVDPEGVIISIEKDWSFSFCHHNPSKTNLTILNVEYS